ncbi:MAG: hypothetical protein GXX90_02295 [Microbacteriaceae bacterium]|nr:hypothetical protein [Microbacteriaceae bacterium]
MSFDTMKKTRAAALLATLAGASLALTGCFSLPNFGGGDDEPETEGQTTEVDTGTDTGGDTGTEVETEDESFQNPETMGVFDIKVGDCIANDDGSDPMATEVYDVATVPCSQPHAYEVFHEFEMPDQADYPGDEPITDAAIEGCFGPAFEDFVGVPYETSQLYVVWYSPTAGSWDVGDRLISCLILEPEAEDGGNPTTGSLQNANR